MSGAPRRQLLLDVTSLTRWVGPAVGIARVEHALAKAARRREDASLVVIDPATGEPRGLAPRWADLVLGWSGLVDRHETRGRGRELLSRQGAVMALERLRLTTPSPWRAGVADRLQRAILALRPHRFPLRDAQGARVANVPRDLALGEARWPGRGDTLLLAGSGWSRARVAGLAAGKARHGFALAALCYDLIPVTHPQFYADVERQDFIAHWRALLPQLDQLLVTSSAIAGDVAGWALREGLPVPPIAIVDLGCDPPSGGQGAALPEGLTAGSYALFVSTLEPRKGHAVLLAAWQLLLAQGLPQRLDFRLVLVGRVGWMVDGVLGKLARRPAGVMHLPAVADDVLAALYRGAAFCCYPSQYEGFGLPLIEAFAHGRAVLASTGGALAETGAGLARGLDPFDIPGWAAALAEWMAQPGARHPYEARIVNEFHHPSWPEAASRILDLVSGGPQAGDFR